MQNAAEQNQTVNGKSAETADGLTTRLLQRFTKPVGVINTHHPMRLRAQTQGWIARRYELLDQLQSRYGVEQTPQSGDEMVFSIPAHPMRQTAAADSTFSASRLSESSGQSQAAPKAQTQTTSLLRVSRRSETLARVADSSKPVIHGGEQTRQPTATVEIPSGNVDSAIGVTQASTPLVLPQFGAEQFVAVSQRSSGELMRSIQPESAAVNPAQLQTGQTSDGQANSTVHRTESIDRIPATANAAQPVLARSRELSQHTVDQPSAQVLPNRVGSEPIQSPVIAVEMAAQSDVSVPVVGQSSDLKRQTMPGEIAMPLQQAMPVIQRKANDETRDDLPQSSTTPAAQIQPLPVTAEIPAVSAPAPSANLIWRKSATGNFGADAVTGKSGFQTSALPLKIEAVSASAPVIARQANDSPVAESGAAMNTLSTMTAKEIDIAQLADQVGRLLSRQLAVERERRGMK